MGDFSPAWLALREPFDHAARSAALTRELLEWLPARPVGILDLACGTGSNYRFFEATLKGSRHGVEAARHGVEAARHGVEAARHEDYWLLVDRDPTVLAQVLPVPNVTVRQQDLSVLDDALFAGRSVVTASALLDLVSESWLHHLAARCVAHRAAALFALTYDGRMSCEPRDPADAQIRALVNQHQRTDKGFGPALGADASARVEATFGRLGYRVSSASSDWVLDGASRELQRQLVDGWAEAAAAIAPAEASQVRRWRLRRVEHIEAGRSRIVVGHQDQLAILR